jgi:YbbR domain-containing protein
VPFRRAITNNMHLKLAALTVGVLLWMFAKAEQEASRLFSVPLILRNVPDGLTTVKKIPKTVDVVLGGDNKSLVRLSLWGKPHAVVDMAGAQAGRTFRVSLSAANVVLPGDAQVQVLEVRNPRNLDLEIDDLLDRRVAVAPAVEGQPAEGFYRFGTTRSLPDSVFVFGPASVVSGLKSVQPAVLSIEGRRSPVDAARPIVFRQDWNLHAVPKEVRILVDIEGTRVMTLAEVPIVFDHEPGFSEATVAPTSVELTLSGPDHIAASLDTSDVKVVVDAMGLPKGTHELVPNVKAPDGIEVHGVIPARVTVTLQ